MERLAQLKLYICVVHTEQCSHELLLSWLSLKALCSDLVADLGAVQTAQDLMAACPVALSSAPCDGGGVPKQSSAMP